MADKDRRHHAKDEEPMPGSPPAGPARTEGQERGEEPAAGTVEDPVAPGEAQAGNLGEAAANLGGPVDVVPGARGHSPRER
jgi:hypothetical protein